jgi:hypothetical protein
LWLSGEVARVSRDVLSFGKYVDKMNALLLAMMEEEAKLAEIQALDTLIVERGDERWELKVENSLPTKDGVRLWGEAIKLHDQTEEEDE